MIQIFHTCFLLNFGLDSRLIRLGCHRIVNEFFLSFSISLIPLVTQLQAQEISISDPTEYTNSIELITDIKIILRVV